jgi:hypothetical protein
LVGLVAVDDFLDAARTRADVSQAAHKRNRQCTPNALPVGGVGHLPVGREGFALALALAIGWRVVLAICSTLISAAEVNNSPDPTDEGAVAAHVAFGAIEVHSRHERLDIASANNVAPQRYELVCSSVVRKAPAKRVRTDEVGLELANRRLRPVVHHAHIDLGSRERYFQFVQRLHRQ